MRPSGVPIVVGGVIGGDLPIPHLAGAAPPSAATSGGTLEVRLNTTFRR
jgi:hypothetical protein